MRSEPDLLFSVVDRDGRDLQPPLTNPQGTAKPHFSSSVTGRCILPKWKWWVPPWNPAQKDPGGCSFLPFVSSNHLEWRPAPGRSLGPTCRKRQSLLRSAFLNDHTETKCLASGSFARDHYTSRKLTPIFLEWLHIWEWLKFPSHEFTLL